MFEYKDEPKSDGLLFSDLMLRKHFISPIEVYTGTYGYLNNRSYEVEMASWENRKKLTVIPQSKINKNLLGIALPKEDVNRSKAIFEKRLPSYTIKSVPKFNLVNTLNEAKLLLPEQFFLKQKDLFLDENANDWIESEFLDTALSENGLHELISYYAKAMDIIGEVFMDSEKFNESIAKIKPQALLEQKDFACLVCFEESKRHVTGFYFKLKDNQLTAYIFDTTGLTLPAFPCSYRNYPGSEIKPLYEIFQLFEKNSIGIAIMPINTVLSIQKDRFSCLLASLLFFNSMKKNFYETLDTPGITECFGKSAFWKNAEQLMFFGTEVSLYTTNYLPLLAGCQSRFPLLFMIDPLKNADILLAIVVKFQTDWQRETRISSKRSELVNIFWQFAYVELLKWFDKCYHNQNIPFPDFEELVCNGYPERYEKSSFETKLIELNFNLIEGNIFIEEKSKEGKLKFGENRNILLPDNSHQKALIINNQTKLENNPTSLEANSKSIDKKVGENTNSLLHDNSQENLNQKTPLIKNQEDGCSLCKIF